MTEGVITFMKVMPTPRSSLRSPDARSSLTERLAGKLGGRFAIATEDPPFPPSDCRKSLRGIAGDVGAGREGDVPPVVRSDGFWRDKSDENILLLLFI